MPLKPYKFVIKPVVQQLDDDGGVIADGPLAARDGGQEILYEVFGCEALEEWARNFPVLLKDSEIEPSASPGAR